MSLSSLQIEGLVKAKIYLSRFVATSESALQESSKYDAPCQGKIKKQKEALKYLFALDHAGYLTSSQVDTLLMLSASTCGANTTVTLAEYLDFINSLTGQAYLIDSDGDGVPDVGTGGGEIIEEPPPPLPPIDEGGGGIVIPPFPPIEGGG